MTERTIGWLARAAGVPISTIRLYERKHVLATAARTQAGYRSYSEDDLEQIQLVLRAKQVGFTLLEIAELFGGGERAAPEVLAAAQHKRQQVIDELARLSLVVDRLDRLVAVCDIGDAGSCQTLHFGETPLPTAPLGEKRTSRRRLDPA